MVYQGPGERNFHVFYQLLAGADKEFRKVLGISDSPKDYPYLNQSGCFTVPGTDDAKDFFQMKVGQTFSTEL